MVPAFTAPSFLLIDIRATLLLEPGVFSGGTECLLSNDKKWHKARLERSIEHGFDYERVETTFV